MLRKYLYIFVKKKLKLCCNDVFNPHNYRSSKYYVRIQVKRIVIFIVSVNCGELETL